MTGPLLNTARPRSPSPGAGRAGMWVRAASSALSARVSVLVRPTQRCRPHWRGWQPRRRSGRQAGMLVGKVEVGDDGRAQFAAIPVLATLALPRAGRRLTARACTVCSAWAPAAMIASVGAHKPVRRRWPRPRPRGFQANQYPPAADTCRVRKASPEGRNSQPSGISNGAVLRVPQAGPGVVHVQMQLRQNPISPTGSVCDRRPHRGHGWYSTARTHPEGRPGSRTR